MWTHQTRVLVGDYGSGQTMSDKQYGLLEPLIPTAKKWHRSPLQDAVHIKCPSLPEHLSSGSYIKPALDCGCEVSFRTKR